LNCAVPSLHASSACGLRCALCHRFMQSCRLGRRRSSVCSRTSQAIASVYRGYALYRIIPSEHVRGLEAVPRAHPRGGVVELNAVRLEDGHCRIAAGQRPAKLLQGGVRDGAERHECELVRRDVGERRRRPGLPTTDLHQISTTLISWLQLPAAGQLAFACGPRCLATT
jgi:hypothetical protein